MDRWTVPTRNDNKVGEPLCCPEPGSAVFLWLWHLGSCGLCVAGLGTAAGHELWPGWCHATGSSECSEKHGGWVRTSTAGPGGERWRTGARLDRRLMENGKSQIGKVYIDSGIGLDFLVQAPLPAHPHLPSRDGLCRVRGGPPWSRAPSSEASQTAQGGGRRPSPV